MNRKDAHRFRTLDNWTKLSKEEEIENRRRGKFKEAVLKAASKDSTIINEEWEGEGY